MVSYQIAYTPEMRAFVVLNSEHEMTLDELGVLIVQCFPVLTTQGFLWSTKERFRLCSHKEVSCVLP